MQLSQPTDTAIANTHLGSDLGPGHAAAAADLSQPPAVGPGQRLLLARRTFACPDPPDVLTTDIRPATSG